MNILTNGLYTIDFNEKNGVYLLELNDGENGHNNKVYLSPIHVVEMMEYVKKNDPLLVKNYKAIKESVKEAKGTQAEGLINLLGDGK